ncbi:MAG TPA: hypothetical protein V6D17_14150 [Candidatus Obscuribacterales bacterium]
MAGSSLVRRVSMISGCVLVLTGCASVEKQAPEPTPTSISRQLKTERIRIDGDQVFLDGKKVGRLNPDASPEDRRKHFGLPERLPNGSSAYAVTDLGNGLLFLSGGYEPEKEGSLPRASKKTFFWHVSDKKLEAGPDMSCPRVEHNITQLPTGKWLISGGKALTAQGSLAKAVDILDPKSKTIVAGGELKVDRIYHSVIPLDGDHVLIAGGQTDLGPSPNGMETKSVELYEVNTRSSLELGELCRTRQSATLLRLDGREVLLVGGYNSDSERGSSVLLPEIITLPLTRR